MQTISQKEWKEILTKVFKRASSDQEFHKLCLTNAKEAIKQVSGKDIPDDLNIRFVDQSEELVFMLPSTQLAHGEQLSDEQLEMLAGGMSVLPLNMTLGLPESAR